MSRRIPPLFRISTAILTLTAGAFAEPKCALPEELPDAIAWFNQLTVPDVAEKPYVEVVDQRYLETGGKLYERKRRGFLIDEDETTWTLVPDGTSAGDFRRPLFEGWGALWPARIAKPNANALPGASPDRRVLDLHKVAVEILAEIARKPPHNGAAPHDQSGRAGGCTAVFVLARFCERNGFADAAHDLDRALLTVPLDKPRQSVAVGSGRDRVFTLREYLEQDLGSGLLNDTLTTCADERVPRAELLLRFERLDKEFPGIAEIEQVRSHEATLRRMVAEEARPARAVETLPPDEQAREWVFRLRDQTEKKNGAFGSGMKVCVLESEGTPNADRDDRRPAQQLLNLGHAAVPALIEALSDTRLTRTLQTYSMGGLPTVVTVGDCAEEILERISGMDFWLERVRADKFPKRSTPADSRPAAEKWWRDFHERGEPAVMADGIRQGGQSSMTLARRLLERDPAVALTALPEGIAHAETAWIRESLIEQLGRIPQDKVQPLLREEMGGGRWLQSRVAAARVLYRQGDEEAFADMLDEWGRWEPAPGGRRDGESDTPETLVRFLFSAHRVDAIHVLTSRFDNLPVEIRVMILEEIARECDGMFWRSYVQPPWAPSGQPSLRAAIGAAEDFLFHALDDTTVNPHMSYGGGDQPSWQARVCDHAAVALLALRTGSAGRWNGPGEVAIADRDARIATFKAGGRKEQ